MEYNSFTGLFIKKMMLVSYVGLLVPRRDPGFFLIVRITEAAPKKDARKSNSQFSFLPRH